MVHERVHCHEEAADHQLPIAADFWIIWIVSVEECSSSRLNLIQIHCSIHAVILNVTATQYTYSLNSIYRPHWLVQWSRHCLHMHIPVHSPHLPGYIDVTQTVLVMLTTVGHFPDRLYICLQIHMVKLSINFATLCDLHTILNIKNITPVWD